MRESTKVFAWALLALLCAYVVVYFASVRVGGGTYSSRLNRFEASPNYHGLPSELFIPIHWVDRKALRPHLWSYAGTPEEYERHMGILP
jgi:hypothetical protein